MTQIKTGGVWMTWTIAGSWSYLQAPLSLFLSLTADSLLLCSLWTALLLHNILHLNRLKRKSFPCLCVNMFTTQYLYRRALTILSLRLMSSSSSFFLLSKWTSIRVCSSIRSFSILLRCMSCRNRCSELLLLKGAHLCFTQFTNMYSNRTSGDISNDKLQYTMRFRHMHRSKLFCLVCHLHRNPPSLRLGSWEG